MRSIRLWLLLYFLVLLGVALGAVSLYVYRLTQQTMQAKEESVRDLLEERYKEKRRQYEEDFDEQILRRAHILASMAQTQVGRDAAPRFVAASVLTAGVEHHVAALYPGYISVGSAIGTAEVVEGPFLYDVPQLRRFIEVQAGEDLFHRYSEQCPREYFQIYTDRGKPVQRSNSMGQVVFALSAQQRKVALFESSADDAEVQSVPVRRVTLRAPVTRFQWHFGAPRNTPAPSPFGPMRERDQAKGRRDSEKTFVRSSGPPGPPPGPPRLSHEGKHPTIFIQVARETARRDEMLATFKQQFDNDLEQMQVESRAALASLRQRLLLLSLITFAATVVGGVWLVRLGLSPIERIADAVSRVSERNFELPIAANRVPAELSPIVDKLKEALESLRRAFEREKQAAADISHELRTPIAALRATLEVALRKERSTREYRDTLETCQDIGQQLSVLVERLLTLARLDAGADRLKTEPVDVPEIAEQCVGLVRPLAEARGLTLRLERNGPVTIQSDPDKIREVVTNLLHNAIQYNRPHGRVELRVERENGHARLEVQDTGVGIPQHAQARLFERFYRVDPSRHSDTVHAGLGLAIVKGYLDLLGGKIDVQSAEGKGTTFSVTLPMDSSA